MWAVYAYFATRALDAWAPVGGGMAAGAGAPGGAAGGPGGGAAVLQVGRGRAWGVGPVGRGVEEGSGGLEELQAGLGPGGGAFGLRIAGCGVRGAGYYLKRKEVMDGALRVG